MSVNAAEQAITLGLDPDSAAAEARSLIALLGGSAYGAIQENGAYRKAEALSVATLASHLLGDITVALRCANGDAAHVVGWDIDQHVEPRMRVLARDLKDLGLLDYAVATEGSDASRGKVALFVRSVDQSAARKFAAAVIEKARLDPEWGIEMPGFASESRPQAGQGGLLRIGGRNLKRNGPIERVFSLATGEQITFSQIAIAPVNLPATPQPVAAPNIPKYVLSALQNGLTWPTNGSAGIRTQMTRIAMHAINTGRGEAVFFDWCATIRAKSTDLQRPSPTNDDRRGVLSESRMQNLWEAAIERANITSSGGGGEMFAPANDEERLYCALAEFRRARDLHKDGFSISYRELGTRLGWHHAKAYRLMMRLVNSGRVIIVDRGTQGERGDKTIFALTEGRALSDVLAASKSRPVVMQREKKRREYAQVLAQRVVPFVARRPAAEALKTRTPFAANSVDSLKPSSTSVKPMHSASGEVASWKREALAFWDSHHPEGLWGGDNSANAAALSTWGS